MVSDDIFGNRPGISTLRTFNVLDLLDLWGSIFSTFGFLASDQHIRKTVAIGETQICVRSALGLGRRWV